MIPNFLQRLRNRFIREQKVDATVLIEEGSIVSPQTKIGKYTYINRGVQIDENTSEIGPFCSIARNVLIGAGPHPTDWVSTSPIFYSANRGLVPNTTWNEFKAKGYTQIGADVLISANSVVLAGVKVGVGAIVGAGAVVAHDVAPYTVVGGVPAKPLKMRFEQDLVDLLLKSRWWELDVETLFRWHAHFANPRVFAQEVIKFRGQSIDA